MAQKGFLKIAKNKTSKKEQPFVSVLILDKADDKEAHWYNIFDPWWFGGTDKSPSPYDICAYASQTEPTLVVYEFITTGEFRNITAIRPDAEKWSPKKAASEEMDEGAAEATEATQLATGSITARQMIASAIENLVDGIALIVSERMKEE